MKEHIRKIFLFVIVQCVLFTVSVMAIDIPDNVPSWKGMDKELMADMLAYGDLIAVDSVGGGIEMVSLGMLADAPIEQVWKTVAGFEAYGTWMPDTFTTKSVSKEGNTEVVDFIVHVLKMGIIDITQEYTLKYYMEPPDHLKITWVKGDVKNVEGFWELYPVDGGKKTIAIYAITSDLSSTKPEFVGKLLAKQPSTVMAINLSSAIVFAERVMEEAAGKKRPKAPKGSEPIWKKLDDKSLHSLLSGGRVGFISRIGDKEIATAGVLARKPQEKVWNVLTDFGSYKDKIQQIKQSKVKEKNEKFARVQMKTELIALGPIKIATKGINKYTFEKPSKMDCKGEKDKSKVPGLFNRWELVPLAGGSEIGLLNESVSDLTTMGKIANAMLEKLPALQISIDLSQGMIMTNEIQKWAESQ